MEMWREWHCLGRRWKCQASCHVPCPLHLFYSAVPEPYLYVTKWQSRKLNVSLSSKSHSRKLTEPKEGGVTWTSALWLVHQKHRWQPGLVTSILSGSLVRLNTSPVGSDVSQCHGVWIESKLTIVFLPGESHGQRSLTGYGPQGRKELDTTEVIHAHT